MSIPGGNNVIGDVARPPAAGRARIPPAAEGRRPRRPAAVPGAGPEQGEPAMSDAPVLLEMRSITKEFPGVKALSDVNLVVRSGEIHAICGENGAGKSTLMKVLSGVYPHGTYDGQIVYQGQEVRFADIRA